MAQCQMVEGQTELKCDANKFFDVWGRKPYLVRDMCPKKYSRIELHQGDWHEAGAVIGWNYVIHETGEHSSAKSEVVELDEENKIVKYKYIDGHFMEFYNTLSSKIQVTPIPNGEGCIVKWSFECEKKNENAPDLNFYINYMLAIARDIDACICRV